MDRFGKLRRRHLSALAVSNDLVLVVLFLAHAHVEDTVAFRGPGLLPKHFVVFFDALLLSEILGFTYRAWFSDAPVSRMNGKHAGRGLSVLKKLQDVELVVVCIKFGFRHISRILVAVVVCVYFPEVAHVEPVVDLRLALRDVPVPVVGGHLG